MYITLAKYRQRYQRLRGLIDIGRRLKLIWPYLRDEEQKTLEQKYNESFDEDEALNYLKSWLKDKQRKSHEGYKRHRSKSKDL